jgi:DNA modification methylase
MLSARCPCLLQHSLQLTVNNTGSIEPFVKATTEKNDMVLDVFAGSGTTGVVALDLGRRFVGYEINSDFCKLCEHRVMVG